MVAQELVARDVPVRQIARDLDVDASTYHVARDVDAHAGRRDRPSIMDAWQDRVTAGLQRFDDPRNGGDAGTTVEEAVVHGVLRLEVGFTVDPCRAAIGRDKGKIERHVRAARVDVADLFVADLFVADLFVADWQDLPTVEAALDRRSAERHQTRQCPVTGTSIAEAHGAERVCLQAPSTLDELADCVVARRVSRDCLVSLETVGLTARENARAVRRGFQLNADATTTPARLRARRCCTCGRLIVDEIGFRQLDRVETKPPLPARLHALRVRLDPPHREQACPQLAGELRR